MLDDNPQNRPTVDELLSDDWFNEDTLSDDEKAKYIKIAQNQQKEKMYYIKTQHINRERLNQHVYMGVHKVEDKDDPDAGKPIETIQSVEEVLHRKNIFSIDALLAEGALEKI